MIDLNTPNSQFNVFNKKDKTIITLIVTMSLHKLCFFQGIFAFVNWAGIK
jgi:hypothetical protein